MKPARVQPPLDGLVYGPILNDRGSLLRLGAALEAVPYKAPPQAPALFVKPRNTQVASGAAVALPAGATTLAIGGQLGLVVGRAASRLTESDALDCIAGYLAVIDLSIPHASVYRPAIREKCFDGACPMGAAVVDRAAVGDLAQLSVRTYVCDALVAERRLDDLVRPAAKLLADVTEFMTLFAGDVLLLGAPLELPEARAGDTAAVEIAGVGRVECRVVGEAR
jgi:5-oxopent-3-ene-1,2,5-tricarboxylate decarboxylase/2-hydroxyhepta-2,4-diene-1,7-dioate isomerase